MISQQVGHTLHKPIMDTLLRSLLPSIVQNQEWSQFLTQLAKVNKIVLIIDNKLVKNDEIQNTCPICQNFSYQDNLFVLILHMEIQHEFAEANFNHRRISMSQQQDTYKVKKYQFTFDGIQIHLVRKSVLLEQMKKQSANKKSQKLSNIISNHQGLKENYVSICSDNNDCFLQSSLKRRNLALLGRVFSKFSKRLQTISTERRFYHSYNVYHVKSPESESQDSQEEQKNMVQIQLQRLRINDFNDVSHWDKLLFLEWNNMMRKEKKQQKVVYEDDQIVNILERFIIICKKKEIPRLNFNMHLYTLWSVGRIKDYNIIGLLNAFDSYSNKASNHQ